jgi:hypothetical protein
LRVFRFRTDQGLLNVDGVQHESSGAGCREAVIERCGAWPVPDPQSNASAAEPWLPVTVSEFDKMDPIDHPVIELPAEHTPDSLLLSLVSYRNISGIVAGDAVSEMLHGRPRRRGVGIVFSLRSVHLADSVGARVGFCINVHSPTRHSAVWGAPLSDARAPSIPGIYLDKWILER